MKYLIFSDTHLTEKFNQNKFNFLKKIISSTDKVIIAGDFYDQYFIDLDQFLNSDWQPLFKLLKKKKTVYIPGNHDLVSKSRREKIFCDEIADKYKFVSGGQEFLIQHGHEIDPGLERYDWFLTNEMRRLITFIHNIVENIFVNLFGWLAPHFFLYRYKGLWKTANHKKKYLPKDKWLISGHIHLACLKPEIRYANTGFINFGLASYIIIEDGEVELKKERY